MSGRVCVVTGATAGIGRETALGLARMGADGFELTFAVNHLAPFLFTREIMPLLRAGAPARIVNVASAAEAHGPIDFGDLQSEERYRGFLVYGKTKLMNVRFTYELAARRRRARTTSRRRSASGQ